LDNCDIISDGFAIPKFVISNERSDIVAKLRDEFRRKEF
jgi:hypothetical protein